MNDRPEYKNGLIASLGDPGPAPHPDAGWGVEQAYAFADRVAGLPTLKMSRAWAMPSKDTFSVDPIAAFVARYLETSRSSVDPFSRNALLATYRNDLNPNTAAEHHMDAIAFLEKLGAMGVRCDLALLDPPYSPRQITECYAEARLKAGMQDTQNARLYAATRAALLPLLTDNAIVLSFGWNSSGMGIKHGFEIVEILLVCHGSAHNDTICVAERRVQASLLAA